MITKQSSNCTFYVFLILLEIFLYTVNILAKKLEFIALCGVGEEGEDLSQKTDWCWCNHTRPGLVIVKVLH